MSKGDQKYFFSNITSHITGDISITFWLISMKVIFDYYNIMKHKILKIDNTC